MTSSQTATESNQSVVDLRIWNCLTPLVSNNSRWIGSIPKEPNLSINPPLSETILDTSHESSVDCVRQNVLESKGLCKFLNGNSYEGKFRGGKMEGEGVYLWEDGTKYEGELSGNKIQGSGTYIWTDGSGYRGEVRNGLRNGSGVLTMVDGMYYSGEWNDGKMHGSGRMVFECDEEGIPVSYYEGKFRNNMREGTGTRLYRSGNLYDGEWLCNLPHGKGRMEWRARTEVYTGNWCEGVQNGYGEMLWETDLVNSAQFPNKNRYIGEWRGGRRHGTGIMYYATGAVYSGSWTADKKEGTGIYTQPNGNRVEGEFREDKLFRAKETPGYRPLTPVSQLVGDVDETDSSSRSEAFKISLMHLIPDNINPDIEVKAVYNILLVNIGELKWIFHFYSNLGVFPGASHCFTRLKLWQLLIDCRIFYKETFCEVDQLFCTSLPDKHTHKLVHNPEVEFLLREFLQCLVVLGHFLFSKLYGGESGRLAWCLKYLIEETVLPNACRGTGYLYQTPVMLEITEPYFGPCNKLYNAACEQLNGTINYRKLLFMMDDCKMLELVPVETVLGFIINSNPFVYEEGCYKVMLQINFLEFFNILLCCAKLTGHSASAMLFQQMSKQVANYTEGDEVDKMGSLYQSGSSVANSGQREDGSETKHTQSGIYCANSYTKVKDVIAEDAESSAVLVDTSQQTEVNSSNEPSQVRLNPEEKLDTLLFPTNISETPGDGATFTPVLESASEKWRRQLTTLFDENLFAGATLAFQPPKYNNFSLI